MHMNLREICAASSAGRMAGRFQLVLASTRFVLRTPDWADLRQYLRRFSREDRSVDVIYIIWRWSVDQHRIRNPRVDVQS